MQRETGAQEHSGYQCSMNVFLQQDFGIFRVLRTRPNTYTHKGSSRQVNVMRRSRHGSM